MWYAVYNKKTGQEVSYGTVLADPFPKHLAYVEIGLAAPDFERQRWNPETKSLEDIVEQD